MIDEHISIKELGKSIRLRLKRDLDFVITISGKSGYGKSALGYHLAEAIETGFDHERFMIFSPNVENIIKQYDDAKQFGGIILDEAIKILFSHEWAHAKQKLMKKFFDVNRFQNKFTIITLPSFKSLNASFRNQKTHIWIHVFSRGKAVILYPSENPFKADVWDFRKNEKLFDMFDRRKNIEENWITFITKLSKTKSFAFTLDFPDYPEKIKPWIAEMKVKYEKHDLTLMEEEEEAKVDWRVINKIKEKYNLINFDIGLLAGYSASHVGDKLRELRYDDEDKVTNIPIVEEKKENSSRKLSALT